MVRMTRTILTFVLLAAPVLPGGPADTLFGIAEAERERLGPEATASALRRALEVDPTHSDALYRLSAVAAMRGDLRDSIRLLEEAIRGNGLRVATPDRARLELASMLLRTGRLAESEASLAAVSDLHLHDPLAARLTCRLLLRRGLHDRARAAADRWLARFPMDAELVEIAVRARLEAGDRSGATGMVDNAHAVHPGEPRFAALRVLVREGTATHARAVEEYVSAGGSDPRVLLGALTAAPTHATFTRFLESGGSERGDLLLPALRAFPAGAAATGGFSGRRIVDADQDGQAEQIGDYKDGRLLRWRVDQDQDGAIDRELDLEAGRLVLSSGRLVLDYGPFPWLTRVTRTDETGDTAFVLPLQRVRGPRIRGLETGIPLDLVVEGVPDEKELLRTAVRLVRDSGGGRSEWTLLQGRPLVLEMDAERDGMNEHVVVFDPGSGTRDLDADGDVEVRELWQSGVVTAVMVDLDHNGIPELVMSSRSMTWDFDQDGKPDRQGPAEPMSSLNALAGPEDARRSR